MMDTMNKKWSRSYIVPRMCVIRMNKPQGARSGGKKWMNKATRLLLVKCYDNKIVKLTFNLIISPLIKPQVAKQQKNELFYYLLVSSLNVNRINIPTWSTPFQPAQGCQMGFLNQLQAHLEPNFHPEEINRKQNKFQMPFSL